MGVRCAPPPRGTRSASGRRPFYSEARGAPHPAASAGRAHPDTEKTDQPTRRAHHVAAPCGQASTYETGQGQEPTAIPALSARQICGQTLRPETTLAEKFIIFWSLSKFLTVPFP